MAGITLAQAEAQLQIWVDAEAAIANGQSFTIGGRTFTRAQLKEVGDRITFWDSKVKILSMQSSRSRACTVSPR